MAILQDSIHNINSTHVPSSDSVAHVYSPRTPYQVLRMLPDDATPEQQDSAIQAHFQPAEIHYSQCPDTLHLPGHDVPKPQRWEDVPVYYKETFFSNDTLFQTEYTGMRNGVPGVSVPYSMRTDPYIAIVLLAFVFFSTIICSKMRAMIVRKFETLFHTMTFVSEKDTTSEVMGQLALNLMSAMLIAFLMFSYVQIYVSDTYLLPTEYHLMGIFLGLVVGYKLLDALCGLIVNSVFWSSKQNLQYLKTKVFLGAMEGILLLLMVMVRVYFELSTVHTLISFVFVLVVVKILTFYKCYVIFFNQRGGFIQFFLYLCALEIIPIGALGAAAMMTANILKVNF